VLIKNDIAIGMNALILRFDYGAIVPLVTRLEDDAPQANPGPGHDSVGDAYGVNRRTPSLSLRVVAHAELKAFPQRADSETQCRSKLR
jgi:hypothetical protein